MSAFDDARALVAHCEERLPVITQLYEECAQDKTLKASVCIEVKGYLEHLRSALDYCATAIYKKHGAGKPSHRPYFPYATNKDTEATFRTVVMERALPGIAAARPSILVILSRYQYYGNTGNWMPMFMEMTNENKHREFSPQAIREYTLVNIRQEIPPGGSATIDLTSIPLGERPGYKAEARKLTTYEFITTGAVAYGFLESLPKYVRSILSEIEAAY